MSKKIDKHDLKGPDAFVSFSDHVLAWMEKHAKSIGAVFAVALVVAVGAVVYGYVREHQEASAADAIFRPEAELRKVEAEFKGGSDPMGIKPPTPAKTADFTKDYLPAVEKVQGEIKSHAGTKTALVSAMNLASFLVEQKQFERAVEVLSLPTYRPSGGDVLAGFWNMHRGLAFLETKKYKEAAEAYEAILKSAELKSFHPEAMLKLGLAQEMQGDKAKARATYEKLGREFPTSEASATGQQYLRLMDLSS